MLSAEDLRHDGARRTHTIVCPDDSQGLALVVVLHGLLQTADAIRRFTGRRFEAFADAGSAAVVYPNARRRDWNGARKAVMVSARTKQVDDVGYLRALVDFAEVRHGIDPSRVYVVGFSLGGQMVIRLLHDAPSLLAGAAIVGANMPTPENAAMSTAATSEAGVPVLTIHGTDDPYAPYEGGMVSMRGLMPKGEHLSAEDTAEYFAGRNGITTPGVSKPVPEQTNTRMTRTDFRQSGRAPVTLLTVHGGGHQVPDPITGLAPRLYRNPTPDIDLTAAFGDFFGLDY